MTTTRISPWPLAAGAVLTLLLAACAPATSRADAVPPRPAADWAAVTEAADGQMVRWWMYGGDERANRYVDEHVTPAAAQLGVTLERVPVGSTRRAGAFPTRRQSRRVFSSTTTNRKISRERTTAAGCMGLVRASGMTTSAARCSTADGCGSTSASSPSLA